MKDGNKQNHYNILICDDDDTYRSSQVRILNLFNWSNSSHVDFKAYEASSGAIAIDILRKEAIDCVLLDYDMPEADGLEVLKQMLESYPELAVVMVTGHGNEMTARDAMQAGAMDYLRKDDLSIDLLERTIVHAVTRMRMQRQIESQSKALLEAERHRVMMQSLATACHHLAQPATVLRTYIVMLKRDANDEQTKIMLTEAYKAIEVISNVIWKLNRISEYRTEPYIAAHPEVGQEEIRMLKMQD